MSILIADLDDLPDIDANSRLTGIVDQLQNVRDPLAGSIGGELHQIAHCLIGQFFKFLGRSHVTFPQGAAIVLGWGSPKKRR